MSDRNYLNYSNELIYYTGLNRRNISILHTLREDLLRDYNRLQPIIAELDNYNIGLEISIPDSTFPQKLAEARLSQKESDDLSDPGDASERV